MSWIVGTARASALCAALIAVNASADQASTVAALRMDGTVLGGLMPTTSPLFTQMATAIQGGNYSAAATIAIGSPYFGQYLARRIAKEMQNPKLNSQGVPDNDATTYIVAHLLNASGTGVTNSGASGGIDALWTDNVTCLINVNGQQANVGQLSATQLAAVNWQTQIICSGGQADANGTAIPAQHVGGYTTLSSTVGDGSYASNAFNAGTNLRGIEYIYEIGMGLQPLDLASFDGAEPQYAPGFVPEGDPNFFVGNNQPACIFCHGGGVSNLLHGYGAVADIFDFDPNNGFTFVTSTTDGNGNSTQKSLGSDPTKRAQVATCLANNKFPSGFTTCNPDSTGISATQAWDLSSWQASGALARMGWNGSTSGSGLNAFGTAFGKASLTYQFMVSRVISEICPTGTITGAAQAAIASQAQTNDLSPGTGLGGFATIVANVASNPACY